MAIRQQVESEREQVGEKDTLPDFFFFILMLYLCVLVFYLHVCLGIMCLQYP